MLLDQKSYRMKKQNAIWSKKSQNATWSKKLQNEKDIQLLKAKLGEITKENIKLKKTVDKMLSNYQQKIGQGKLKNKSK